MRCFEDGNIIHVEGSVDPIRDVEVINLELILADMEQVDRRLGRLAKQAKSGDKAAKAEQAVLEKSERRIRSRITGSCVRVRRR